MIIILENCYKAIAGAEISNSGIIDRVAGVPLRGEMEEMGIPWF
jgi:hypothetical protein